MADVYTIKEKEHYDELYLTKNVFKNREWLYKPFIDALVTKAKLRKGSSLLDVGCGQGFFPYLFALNDLKVTGVDLSKSAVDMAIREYGSHATFFERDIFEEPLTEQYDCVYTRSLSLYNRLDLDNAHDATIRLLEHVKPGGLLIFDYNSRLKPRTGMWTNHSVKTVREHFRLYNGQTYFCSRLDTWGLGAWAFSSPVQWASHRFAKTFGLGGEIVALIRKA